MTLKINVNLNSPSQFVAAKLSSILHSDTVSVRPKITDAASRRDSVTQSFRVLVSLYLFKTV